MELKQKASITGLRILSVLNILLKGAASKNEILDILLKNSNIKNITRETITLDINTLKSAGFEIENLKKGGGYRYKINWNPIKFKLSKKEADTLCNIKDAVLELSEPDFIIKLYKLFLKIAEFIEKDKNTNKIADFKYFLNIDFALLKELYALSKRKKEVKLLYNSPNSGKKEILIKLKDIKYINSKLYITGFSLNYPDITTLRVDHIIKVLKILKTEKIPKTKSKSATCKIKSSLKNELDLLSEEKILSENKNFIRLEIKADNDFMLIQRLLSFGGDLISINNKDIKEKYLLKLKEIKAMYEGKI